MTWFLALPVAAALFANVPNGPVREPTIEPPGVEPSDPPVAAWAPQPASPWYGAPALAVDGAVAVGLAVVVEMNDNRSSSGTPAVVYGLGAAYLLGGPLVHLAHGHAARSAESFLVRAGALAAGLALAVAISDRPRSGCADESADATCPAGYGLLLAPVTAMLVDDLLLAREPAARSARALSSRVVVQPGLALLGVGGTF